MEPSEGHPLIKMGKVCKLRKVIYGLKQSPRAWYHRLSKQLLYLGIKKCYFDNTLFTIESSRDKLLLVYMWIVSSLLATRYNAQNI